MEEPQTPRPNIDTTQPEVSKDIINKRRLSQKKRMPFRSIEMKQRDYYIVNKYRSKQKTLLEEEYDSDPDPYAPTFVFFCFQGKLED